MSATAYTVPENPADPESAAYEMIVRMPELVMAKPGRVLHPIIEVLQDYTGLLAAQDALAGLAWDDARQIAAAIAFDLCNRDEPGDFLRSRARNALSGADNMGWKDRARVARALSLAGDAADM